MSFRLNYFYIRQDLNSSDAAGDKTVCICRGADTMTDPAIAGALAQRKQLEAKLTECEAKIKRLRAQLADTNRFIAQWEKFSGRQALPVEDDDHLFQGLNVSQNGTDSKQPTWVRNPKKEDVAEAARSVIGAHGEPMARSDLFKALYGRGIILQGADPEMVLSTMLWRMRNRIVRLKGGGYWLADHPWKPAGYEPGQNTDQDAMAEMDYDEASHAISGDAE